MATAAPPGAFVQLHASIQGHRGMAAAVLAATGAPLRGVICTHTGLRRFGQHGFFAYRHAAQS